MSASNHHSANHLGASESGHNSFWVMANRLSSMTEHERISRIRSGFEVAWLTAAKSAFDLDASAIAGLANVSIKTLRQRLKDQVPLDSVASERVDRLAQLAVLAESIFENRSVAKNWMIAPNDSLGSEAPIHLCKTELGG